MIRPLKSLFPLVAVAGILSGCVSGPDYKRPEVTTPDRFRFSGQAGDDSLSNLPWWEVFQDPALQSLARTALTNNQDLAQAAARVEQARFQSAAADAHSSNPITHTRTHLGGATP